MRKILLSAIFLLAAVGGAQAQISLVNPVPHSVKTLDMPLADAPKEWNVKLQKGLQNSIAAQSLAEMGIANNPNSKFSVSLQLAAGKLKRAFTKSEGYMLSITPKGITITGADMQGLFYGVQTLKASLAEGKMEYAHVSDWPDVAFRGVVEGFYGTPWSHENRLRQLEFYGKNKLNVYIYGPKDDPYHRDYWRTPYPAEESKHITELAEVAKKNGVNFYWAIHPGVDIKWNAEDRDALIAKFEKMYELGVRSFAVFFDDISGEGTKADKQAELLNYIDNNFILKKHDVSPLIMCPTEYNRAWANDERGYLQTLGGEMNQSVQIMWTGNSVVCNIDREGMQWVNSRIKRKAYIWWNYPVSDFVRDRMLLGPTYGNDLDINDMFSGFVSNPMQYAEASKISLYSIADYTWNMAAYDYKASYEKSLADILPHNTDALRTFALYNKDLGANGHGFRRAEGEEMEALSAAITSGKATSADIDELEKKCRNLATAADILLADTTNTFLIAELTPWLMQAKNVAAYGEAVCQMSRSITSAEAFPTFSHLYAQVRSLQVQMFEMEGSPLRHEYQTGCKLAAKVLLPTVNALFTQSVDKYNAAIATENASAKLNSVADYNPYSISSNVAQLAGLQLSVKVDVVDLAASNEIINWQDGGQLVFNSERPLLMNFVNFNFGKSEPGDVFTLEAYADGEWHTIGTQYKKDWGNTLLQSDATLSGMKITALRLTNTSGHEIKTYIKGMRVARK